jgi:type I restriction enzyme S subunit
MIDDLRPYAEMKPSGLPWLGDVPAYWDVKRSKYIFGEVDKRSTTGEETHLSMSQRHGLVPAGQITRSLVSESYAGGKLVERNDLVLNRLKAHLGVFAYAKQPGVISPDYTVLRPQDGAEVRYFEAVLKSPACRGELFTRAKGIVEGFWRLYTDDFYDIRVPVPPLEEQRLIVRFLDWHGGQVARLVRAKKALIGLLNEQKQAIIHRAVTCGLDTNAKLKPSGIPWLGDVPVGWGVIKLARIVRSSNAGEVIDKGWWGRGDGSLYTCARNILKSDYASFPERKRTTGRDLLLTRNGTPYIHRPVPNAIYSNVVQRINLVEGANREYVALALEVAARSMKGYGVSIESLNYDMWKVLTLLSPSPQEQSEIVAYVASETETANAGIDLVEREIALIQEFRIRIVTDVVTGKLDVSAVAATLPETADQDMAFDLGEDEDLDDLPEDSDTEEAAA